MYPEEHIRIAYTRVPFASLQIVSVDRSLLASPLEACMHAQAGMRPLEIC